MHLSQLKRVDSALSAKLESQQFFLLAEDLPPYIAACSKLGDNGNLLVRCNNGRFTCRAEYVTWFKQVIDASTVTEWVRDVSMLAEDVEK